MHKEVRINFDASVNKTPRMTKKGRLSRGVDIVHLTFKWNWQEKELAEAMAAHQAVLLAKKLQV